MHNYRLICNADCTMGFTYVAQMVHKYSIIIMLIQVKLQCGLYGGVCVSSYFSV